jgi:hypothetical protein
MSLVTAHMSGHDNDVWVSGDHVRSPILFQLLNFKSNRSFRLRHTVDLAYTILGQRGKCRLGQRMNPS